MDMAPVRRSRDEGASSFAQVADAIMFTKRHPGFNGDDCAALATLFSDVVRGARAEPKYFVIDFAHFEEGWSDAPDEFDRLLQTASELVLEAPVITVAWVRGVLSGRDLEFALNCSIIVAEEGARFFFGGEPFKLFGVYAALGRKIGFVQTERLIDTDTARSAREMRDFMIVKDVVPATGDSRGVASYLAQAERRHNASQAVFRAQKMAERRRIA